MIKIRKNFHFLIAFAIMSMSYTTSKLIKDPDAPINYTGAPKATATIGQVRYCSNSGCHSDFALNTAGGNVVATGLPTGTYTAGQTYNFTIKITHSAADRTNWGFAIKAVNTVDNDVVGTFATTNGNASLKGTVVAKSSELSHSNAPSTSAINNYTFINLKWTAPAIPTINQANIKFYFIGVAGDADGSEAGDYVYSSTVSASLGVVPVTLNYFNINSLIDNTVSINWQTAQELNTDYFDVETSAGSSEWTKLATINARGNSASMQSYSFIDRKPTTYNSTIYYRLKMIDRDGSYKYSAIQTIKLKNAGVVIDNLSAQPLQGNKNGIFKIHCNSSKLLTVTVSDIAGHLLYNNSLMIASGSNTFEIPGEKISNANGIILIKFTADGFEKTFKQLVK